MGWDHYMLGKGTVIAHVWGIIVYLLHPSEIIRAIDEVKPARYKATILPQTIRSQLSHSQATRASNNAAPVQYST
jgi:hypothetical protein